MDLKYIAKIKAILFSTITILLLIIFHYYYNFSNLPFYSSKRRTIDIQKNSFEHFMRKAVDELQTRFPGTQGKDDIYRDVGEQLSMVVHACNANTWEDKAGRSHV
jgi:hypothetical protein